MYWIRRIFKDYEDFYKKPEYHISENGVILILYNRNYEFGNVGKGIGRLIKAEERRIQLMEMMANNPGITIAELSNELNVTTRTIERDIETLKEKGLIARIGGLNEGQWGDE